MTNTAAPPLTAAQLKQLETLTSGCNPLQLSWLSGYCWALSQDKRSVQPARSIAHNACTVLYLSQTGNARSLARQLAEQAVAAGVLVDVKSAGEYKVKQLANVQRLLVIASTHGEGEPPDDALSFYHDLMGRKAPDLKGMQFGVLALGDSSYQQYCQVGRMIDERLTALGATRWLARTDCDVDFDGPAAQWIDQALSALKTDMPAQDGAIITRSGGVSHHYTRQKPFSAEILTVQRLTSRSSDRDVRHIELDLAGSGIQYAPGDSLGIWFENDAERIDAMLQFLQLDGATPVTVGSESLPLAEALQRKLELTTTTTRQVEQWAALSQDDFLTTLLTDPPRLQAFADTTQIPDLITRSKQVHLEAQALVDILRGLSPRLYSIASSMTEVGEEVHLCVGMVDYQLDGAPRRGGATGFLHRIGEGGRVSVYVEPGEHFHLPDDDAALIMIGPGTGIAPFRAFMQERAARGATGRNWLFFGNPHFHDDFLYQVEWLQWLKQGLLTRLDLAFSRDQSEKIYVQHRLLAAAPELWACLQDGAYVYVCGDMQHMAKDVQTALEQIAVQQGGLSPDSAHEYVEELRRSGRYRRDVY